MDGSRAFACFGPDRFGSVASSIAVGVANVVSVAIVVAVVFGAQTMIEIIVPRRMVSVVALLGGVTEAIGLLAVLELVVGIEDLLQGIVDVLIHVTSRIGPEIRFGLFPIVCKGRLDAVPGAHFFFAVVVRRVRHRFLQGTVGAENGQTVQTDLLAPESQITRVQSAYLPVVQGKGLAVFWETVVEPTSSELMLPNRQLGGLIYSSAAFR